jgi:hypothetical protein
MAYSDDAQSTWDKKANQEEFHERVGAAMADEQETPLDLDNAEASDSEMSDSMTDSGQGFREQIGGDAALMPAEMSDEELVEADLESDLDYDSALSESDDEMIDRDSAV